MSLLNSYFCRKWATRAARLVLKKKSIMNNELLLCSLFFMFLGKNIFSYFFYIIAKVKLYIPSRQNMMLLPWHTQLNVCALAYFDPKKIKIFFFLFKGDSMQLFRSDNTKKHAHENFKKPPSKVAYFSICWAKQPDLPRKKHTSF